MKLPDWVLLAYALLSVIVAVMRLVRLILAMRG